ncbi:glycerophosphodiester phosphodiesterase family protein [Thalassotalea fonticola]|uniref:Glycerophosphodiester phosphodiesterase family protein n=1 Tax=Thalassotalea fonticola TaxID=3065649 RepID=A0ABZ0GJI8_9GAMM|nr:glycerophosphodiester phosphodiesterase family protein [Colwelliaceae bacterium S1-1]
MTLVKTLIKQAVIRFNVVQIAIVPLLSVFISVPVNASQTSAEMIRTQLMDVHSPKVLVVAHRAAWKQAPENSLLSIEHAINLGVDIIEVDIQRTKDGVFVLMHDKTLNRTTNGKGKVSDKTWLELQQLQLINTDGSLSNETIPHLRDALMKVKDKVLINLDKAEWNLAEVLAVVRSSGIERQVILKGKQSYTKALNTLNQFGTYQGIYMPKLNFRDKPKKAKKDNEKKQPTALASQTLGNLYAAFEGSAMAEVKFSSLDQVELQTQLFKQLKQKHRLWVNTLKVSHSANFTDKRALKNPDRVWGTLINHGYSIIQTDEPSALLAYLRKMKYHD